MNQNVAISIIVLAMLYVGYNFSFNREKFDSLDSQEKSSGNIRPTPAALFAMEKKELKSKLDGLKDIKIIQEKRAKLKVERAKEKLQDKLIEFEDKLFADGDNFRELESLQMQISKLRRLAKMDQLFSEQLNIQQIYYLILQHRFTLSQINETGRTNPDILYALEEEVQEESQRPYFINQVREFKGLPPLSIREIASEFTVLLNDQEQRLLDQGISSTPSAKTKQKTILPQGQ